MDLEQNFLESVFPERATILQLPLVDYTLGHELILRRLNSPFLSSERKDDEELIPHLFSCLFICSLPWKEALTQSQDKTLPKQFAAWQKIVARADFHKAIAELLIYIRDGSSMPPFRSVQRKGWRTIEAGAPFHLRLLLVLIRDLKMTKDEAFSCPMGFALWLYGAHYEGQGSIKLLTESSTAIKDALELHGLRRLKADDFLPMN